MLCKTWYRSARSGRGDPAGAARAGRTGTDPRPRQAATPLHHDPASTREEPPPAGAAGVGRGPILLGKTLQRTETRRDESRRVPRTVGARVSNFRGREGARGEHLLLSRAPGSGLRAPRCCCCCCCCSAVVLRRGPASRSHAPPRSGRRGAGRGTPPAVGQRLAPDSGPPGCAPSGRLRPGRGSPRARPLSALCPLPSAAAAFLPRTRPDAAPARRPALRLSGPAPGLRPGRASARTAAPASARPAAPGGAGTRTHTSLPSGTASRALAARGGAAAPQPQRRKREGDTAGQGRRREEGWGDGGGGRDREFPPPPCSQVHPGIRRWKPLEGRGELRLLSGGGGGGGAERILNRRGFCLLPRPRNEGPTETLSSLGQAPRSCPSNSQRPNNPFRQINSISGF